MENTNDNKSFQKNKLKFLQRGLIGIALFAIFFWVCVYRIEAGHAGIKVYNFGDSRGVSNVVEVTGWVLRNPLTQRIYEVPTYVKTANYKLDAINIENNTELRFQTKDGMVICLDASMNYSTPSSGVVQIFKKYRKPVDELENNVLRNLVIESLNQVCGSYTCEQVYEQKLELEAKARKYLKEYLGKEGFIIEQFVIIGELRLPHSVVQNINLKVNATQIALKKQKEVEQEYYESLKRITKARGDSSVTMITASGKANSILVNADAQAKANEKLNNSLTDRLLKLKEIEGWDGAYPSTYVTDGKTNILLKDK